MTFFPKVLMAICFAALACTGCDAEENAGIFVSAKVNTDGTRLVVTLQNLSTDTLRIPNRQFYDPYFRYVVINESGKQIPLGIDLMQRAPVEIEIKPGDAAKFTHEILFAHPNSRDIIDSSCLLLVWLLRVPETFIENGVFYSGSVPLDCMNVSAYSESEFPS